MSKWLLDGQVSKLMVHGGFFFLVKLEITITQKYLLAYFKIVEYKLLNESLDVHYHE